MSGLRVVRHLPVRDTIANFERETGIKVLYDTYESDEVLETKLLTGHTNYDIVVPTDIFFERLIKAGAFRKLDKTALSNSVNLDPEIMRELAVHDPGNLYGIPYTWSTTGIGYNVDKVRERLGSTEFDSWSLLLGGKEYAGILGTTFSCNVDGTASGPLASTTEKAALTRRARPEACSGPCSRMTIPWAPYPSRPPVARTSRNGGIASGLGVRRVASIGTSTSS